MITRRGLLGMGGLAAIGAVAGCSGSKGTGATGPSSAAAQQLDVFWWSDAEKAKQYNSVLSLYGSVSAPNTAKGQFLAYDNYFDKLATLAAAKNVPDVFALNGDNLHKYQQSGLLMELGDVDLGDYDKTGLDSATFDGKLFGINFATEYVVMAYNKQLAAAAGVEVPADASTWDAWAEFFTKLQPKLPSGVYATTDLTASANVFLSWLVSRGKPGIWTADGQMGYNADDASGWFNYWTELRGKKITPPGPQSLADSQAGGGPTNDPTTKGKAVFTAITVTDFPSFQAVNSRPMDLASCPVGTSGRGEWHSFYGWAVSAKAPAQATKDLLHLWFTDPRSWKSIGFSNGLPVSKKALASLSEGATGANAAILALLAKNYPVKPVALPAAPASLGSKWDTAFSQATDLILSGKSTVDAAVKQFMSDSEAAFAG